MYIAQAGASYSYVYGNDANGDGYPGIGIPLDASNDLLRVPTALSDLPRSIVSSSFMGQLVALEPCLKAARGTIIRRNACRGPASHRVDAKLVQPVRLGGGRRFEVSGSVINALNLLNSEWGRVYDVPNLVPVLALDERRRAETIGAPIIPTAEPSFRYIGAVRRDEQGKLRAALPHVLSVAESQWQAQVGVQFFF